MGREINLKIDNIDELSFNRVVNFVNEQWLEVKNENINVPDTQKIATLTALRIAIELIKLRDLQENISNTYEKRIEKFIKELNETDYIN
jgi:cell division protein ZapA